MNGEKLEYISGKRRVVVHGQEERVCDELTGRYGMLYMNKKIVHGRKRM